MLHAPTCCAHARMPLGPLAGVAMECSMACREVMMLLKEGRTWGSEDLIEARGCVGGGPGRCERLGGGAHAQQP